MRKPTPVTMRLHMPTWGGDYVAKCAYGRRLAGLGFSTPGGTGPCHTRMAGATAFTSTASANKAKIAPAETKATAWYEPTDGL